MPSIRTVALAQRAYGISVEYAGIEIAKLVGRKRGGRQAPVNPVQLRLPFSLELADPNAFEIELKSVKPRRYELRIRIKRAG